MTKSQAQSPRVTTKRRARARAWAIPSALIVGTVAAACNAVLGLEAPVQSVSSASSASGSTGTGGSTDGGAGFGGFPVPEAGAAPTCSGLDAALPDAAPGTVFSALSPATGSQWEWFNLPSNGFGTKSEAFGGGTFDGRYVYFAGRSTLVVRYDTTSGSGFESAAAWSSFDLSALKLPGGFEGAVFDGRFVYFVPDLIGAGRSVVARFDVGAAPNELDASTSWTSFDVTTLDPTNGPDGGTATTGFFGGAYDGRYVYLVPHNNGAADGFAVRFDTLAAPPDGGEIDAGEIDAGKDAGELDAGKDAGEPKDASVDAPSDAGGDAGDTPADDGFHYATSWSTFDTAAVNPAAIGFSGAVFDGKYVYFVPQQNNVDHNEVHAGQASIVTRFAKGADFTSPSSWSTFDVSRVNGLAESFIGGGFDGRYVYFVPRTNGVAVRFDTTAASLETLSAWESYDVTRAVTFDAAAATFGGAAFDGRFMYFLPYGTSFATLVRYDTLSTFTADCAWSSVDLFTAGLGDAGLPSNFNGAVFDGRYLYLIPDSYGLVGRLDVKSPAALPNLPSFSGSFW